MGAVRSFLHRCYWLLGLCMLVAGCSTTPEIRPEPIFYPQLPQQPRLQFLTSISSEDDLTHKKRGFDDFLLGGRETDRNMGRPYAVHATHGSIYLTDRIANDILKIDLTANTITPLRPGGRGALQAPSGLWIDHDGTLYVTDIRRRQVVVFDRHNRFVTTVGSKDSLERPVDVAVHSDRIYVCDMQKHQIVVFDRVTGQLVTTIGKPGDKDGELNRPTHITIDQQGNLVVNDAFNFRVQQFAPDGAFLKKMGLAGNALGSLARPKGIAVDRAANMYIADAAFENVQIFNPDGKLLLFFGGAGNKPGSMYLPAGIAIDYQNVAYFQKYADKRFSISYLIYVCNMSGANKLNVYGFGEWKGE